MAEQSHTVTFRLNAVRFELSRSAVESRLARAVPEAGRKHVVCVDGVWFPVMQAFEAAIQTPRSAFNSHTARRHLASLGFTVRGEIESRSSSGVASGEPATAVNQSEAPVEQPSKGWPCEAAVQATLVAALARRGWSILRVADTSTKEHGVDVIALNDQVTTGFEVKGFPGTTYADARRAGQRKPSQPSTQAGHWYAGAVLAAMRLRSREPSWDSAIALPDFPRYRRLFAETSTSLEAAGIHVWWVSAGGDVGRG